MTPDEFVQISNDLDTLVGDFIGKSRVRTELDVERRKVAQVCEHVLVELTGQMKAY